MIDLEVATERGDVVAHTRGFDWSEATVADLDPAEFPMLAGICPYEDTVFNSWQRVILLRELDRLPGERCGGWVDELRRMCGVAGGEPHRYLRLLGD